MWTVESAVEPPRCQSEEGKTDAPQKGKGKKDSKIRLMQRRNHFFFIFLPPFFCLGSFCLGLRSGLTLRSSSNRPTSQPLAGAGNFPARSFQSRSGAGVIRSEEHTSELQSRFGIS